MSHVICYMTHDLEVPVRIEPTIEVLQTPALPLGYGTIFRNIAVSLEHSVAQYRQNFKGEIVRDM